MSGIIGDYPHLDGFVRPEDTVWPQMAEDLRILSEAGNYHRWLYLHIRDALGERIMEVGAGIGTYTPLLLAHGSVCAIEPESVYASYLRSRFRSCDRFSVMSVSLAEWPAETRTAVQAYRPDTFVRLNVLEHVKADVGAVAAMFGCLNPGGYIVLIVPAHKALFSKLDQGYGHYRRYTKADVLRLTEGLSHASVPRCCYMNMLGALGWWWNHIMLRKTVLSGAQTRFFDRCIVPLASTMERLLAPPFGLSLVIWIRKDK